jgi:hypothetical protein
MIDTRKIMALAIAAGAYEDRFWGYPRHWEAANDAAKPPRKAKKDRTMIKAARKQNRSHK